MISLSSGLKMAIVGDAGFARAMGGGIIRIYSGPRPLIADNAVPELAVEIARITSEGRIFYPGNDTEGAGLTFRILPPSFVENNGRWALRGIKAGQASWFRWNWWNVDSNADSFTALRLDGDVGVMGTMADLILPTTTITNGQVLYIDAFVASLGSL